MRYLVKYKFYGKDKKLYKNFSDCCQNVIDVVI